MNELKNINAEELKVGMLLKSAYSLVKVEKVNVRAKTTQVFYSSLYDGYQSVKPWQFKNNEVVRIQN